MVVNWQPSRSAPAAPLVLEATHEQHVTQVNSITMGVAQSRGSLRRVSNGRELLTTNDFGFGLTRAPRLGDSVNATLVLRMLCPAAPEACGKFKLISVVSC